MKTNITAKKFFLAAIAGEPPVSPMTLDQLFHEANEAIENVSTTTVQATEAMEELAKSFPDLDPDQLSIEVDQVGDNVTLNIGQAMAKLDANSLELMNNSTPMPLSNDLPIYHPVRGTSMGSRYFLVAKGPHIAVAARHKGVACSVRIEGGALADQELRQKLEANGFSNLENGYASIHVEVANSQQFTKMVGSVIFLLGVLIQEHAKDLELVSAANGE